MSQAQHLTALQLANEVRVKRGAEHQRIKALPASDAQCELARLILDPPPYLTNALAAPVLTWPKGVGYGKAVAALRWAGASESRTLAELSDRQRRVTAAVLMSGCGPTEWWQVDTEDVLARLDEKRAA